MSIQNTKETNILIYGFNHCGYSELFPVINGPAENVHGYYRRIFGKGELLSPQFYKGHLESDKAALFTHMLTQKVFSNWKKSLQGLILDPILFCIDCSNNPYPLTAQALSSRKGAALFTKIELRHTYKLCFDQKIDLCIRKTALASFVFIKTLFGPEEFSAVLGYEQVSPPWEKEGFVPLEDALAADKENQTILNPDWEILLNREVEKAVAQLNELPVYGNGSPEFLQ